MNKNGTKGLKIQTYLGLNTTLKLVFHSNENRLLN